MQNPIRMDDLGVPLFLETPIYAPPQPQHVAGKGMYNLPINLAKVILWNQTFGINSKRLAISGGILCHGRHRPNLIEFFSIISLSVTSICEDFFFGDPD